MNDRKMGNIGTMSQSNPVTTHGTFNKNMMFMCPQCNKRYEAVVENWCAKQYRKEGSFWIVCRSCGEEK